jgi:ubiquinone/menaquinone biosynthesis C-methylase UbiE
MAIHAADKSFYDAQGDQSESIWTDWQSSDRFHPYLQVSERIASKHFKGRKGISTLELGAGTCTFSLSLSHRPEFGRMICMDISLTRMQKFVPVVSKTIPAALPEKLEHIEGSFNDSLPFENASVDLVLFDASLHHASSPWDLLAECHRILAPGGLLLAQREQFLAHITASRAVSRLLKTEEVQSGVIENTYLRIQYEYFLRARGFDPVFTPVAESRLQRMLPFLNGVAYSKWVIAAQPL